MVLGVSFDPIDENDAFANKFSFPFKLLSDTKREIGLAYGAAETPADGYAKRIAYIIGPDGAIRHVWAKVDVKVFTDQVLAAL